MAETLLCGADGIGFVWIDTQWPICLHVACARDRFQTSNTSVVEHGCRAVGENAVCACDYKVAVCLCVLHALRAAVAHAVYACG